MEDIFESIVIYNQLIRLILPYFFGVYMFSITSDFSNVLVLGITTNYLNYFLCNTIVISHFIISINTIVTKYVLFKNNFNEVTLCF